MVNPAAYSGSAEVYNGFFLQCSLALEIQPPQFRTGGKIILHHLSADGASGPMSGNDLATKWSSSTVP